MAESNKNELRAARASRFTVQAITNYELFFMPAQQMGSHVQICKIIHSNSKDVKEKGRKIGSFTEKKSGELAGLIIMYHHGQGSCVSFQASAK